MEQNINPVESGVNGVANGGATAKSTPDKTQKFRDNHSVTKRLQQELLSLMTCGDKGVSAFPEGENLFKWTGTIHGAPETIYEGLQYKLSMEFSSGYPYSAPVVKFLTPCFHPNVDVHGNICLDVLKEKWSASYDVRTILISIQSLLAEPNNESPLNSQAAELWPNQMAYKKLLLEKYRKNQDPAHES